MRSRCGVVRIVAFFVAGTGVRASRVCFCWQEQHLLMPGVGVGGPVLRRLRAVSGRFGVFLRGVLHSAGFG